jgi:hypothetical protein
MKLISVEKSQNKNKKYVAEFNLGDKTKKVHFGYSPMQDYTTHRDKQRRENYRARHYTGKDAKPDTANALSYHLLWGDSISLRENIKSFKSKYNL